MGPGGEFRATRPERERPARNLLRLVVFPSVAAPGGGTETCYLYLFVFSVEKRQQRLITPKISQLGHCQFL